MTQRAYQYHLTVPKSAIDQLGHVNNVVYLDWVQVSASEHWNHTTTAYFKQEYPAKDKSGIKTMAWVVMNHYIVYKALAFEGDELIVTTCVKKFTAATSERHTSIGRKGEDKILVSAITNWCLLKMPEGKPMRIPKEIIDLF